MGLSIAGCQPAYQQYKLARRTVNEKARGRGKTPSTGSEKCWLPICNSIRSRPGWDEPEVYFRIVHVAQNGHNSAPGDAYREQTVEIALGPKGAFGNGNIGALLRRVLTGGLVTAVPPSRGNPIPPRQPKTPRVVELLRKAIEWQTLLESGKIASQAEIARQEGLTRARVTQIMGMLRLAPTIQEHILSLPKTVFQPAITEHALRPLAQIADLTEQLHRAQRILAY